MQSLTRALLGSELMTDHRAHGNALLRCVYVQHVRDVSPVDVAFGKAFVVLACQDLRMRFVMFVSFTLFSIKRRRLHLSTTTARVLNTIVSTDR